MHPSNSTSYPHSRDDPSYYLDDYKDTDQEKEDTFVWHKKRKRDKKLKAEQQVDPDEVKWELELLKRRRLEREEERRLREEERIQAQREADRAQFGDWESREDEFQLQQLKKRAELRFIENRPHPIDFFTLILLTLHQPSILFQPGFPSSIASCLKDPVLYLENLPKPNLLQLQKDIDLFLVLDTTPSHQTYWKCLSQLCQSLTSNMDTNTGLPTSSRVTPSVYYEIQQLLSHQSSSQLMKLETTIQRKLQSNEPLDIDYWEAMLEAVKLWQCKKQMSQVYQQAMHARHQYCLEHHIEDASSFSSDTGGSMKKDHEESQLSSERSSVSTSSSSVHENKEERDEKVEDDTRLKEQDWKATEQEGVGAAGAGEGSIGEEEKALLAKEIHVTDYKTYTWAYKYRPRKPKYVNRVNTGYEWNKYNQTHYDMDNPPPKVVQGYKFNIFYPDLLDRSKAPTYRIEPKPNSPDTAIIRFIAGAPYEDIAFEIVNKEWEMSHRKGFRCVFDRGVLQLHFQFKRFFYRK